MDILHMGGSSGGAGLGLLTPHWEPIPSSSQDTPSKTLPTVHSSSPQIRPSGTMPNYPCERTQFGPAECRPLSPAESQTTAFVGEGKALRFTGSDRHPVRLRVTAGRESSDAGCS